MKKQQLNYGLILITIMTVFVSSCGSGKKIARVEKQEKVELPFTGSDYRTGKGYLRFVQSHESSDLSNAKSRAMMKAQTGLAQTAEVLLKSVMESYTGERHLESKSEFAEKYNAITQLVIKKKLRNTLIIGEEVYYSKEKDTYTYFIAVEMDAGELRDNYISGISDSGKLRQDFEEAKFRKVFEEEMNKLDVEQSKFVNQ